MGTTGKKILLTLMAVALALVVYLHLTPVWGGVESYAFVAMTVVMTVGCLANALYVLGRRGALTFFGMAVLLGYTFEYFGVHKGFLFGPYYYTDLFGFQLGGVPLIVPLSWFVVIYMSYAIACLMRGPSAAAADSLKTIVWVSLVGGFVTSAYDLALDPFMTLTIKAWVMETPGAYFQEQMRGFAAWGLVSFTVTFPFQLIFRRQHEQAGKVWWQVPRHVAALPVVVYAIWALFFSALGEPAGIRIIAAIAMGIPVLAAFGNLSPRDGER